MNISESGYSAQNGHTRIPKQALKYKPKWGRNKTMPKEKIECPSLPLGLRTGTMFNPSVFMMMMIIKFDAM